MTSHWKAGDYLEKLGLLKEGQGSLWTDRSSLLNQLLFIPVV